MSALAQVRAIELVPVDPDADWGSDEAPFALLSAGARERVRNALLTVVELTGAAPRPLGAHMAVLADGRYCGYVSGGCVEPAIAREAMAMIERGEDGLLRIGNGSPWIDIRLPCGGGVALQVSVDPPQLLVARVRAAMGERRAVSIALQPQLECDPAPVPTGWRAGRFHRRYLPEIRLLIAGESREAATLARLARASGIAVAICGGAGEPPIDRRTAVVALDHDHERELPVLRAALASEAFYIGAMGSARTHAARCDALRAEGVNPTVLARIHAPIGVIAGARDARTLAFSILAEIAEGATRDEAADR